MAIFAAARTVDRSMKDRVHISNDGHICEPPDLFDNHLSRGALMPPAS